MNIPTTAEIRSRIVNFWEQRLSLVEAKPINILQNLLKSALFIIATAFAGIFRLIYLYANWIYNQTDPQTADDENKVIGGTLQNWGGLLKVGDPKPGQAPEYQIDIVGTNGSVLLAGTAYRSASGNIYLLIADIVIALGVATGIIKASVSEDRDNTDYALNIGSELNTVNPFNGIDNPAVVSAEVSAPTNGEDIEDSYRPRVVSNFRIPPQGGSRVDYKRWPLDAEGVADAFPYVDELEPGVMNIYIEATTDIDPDGIPTQAVLDAAQDAITYDPETGLERKPATDLSNVFPISILIFDLEVQGLVAPDLPDAQSKITIALTNTLKAKKPFIDGAEFLEDKNDIVSRSELLAVVVTTLLPLNGTVTDLVLELASVPIESHTLTDGEKSKAGAILFT